MASTETKYWDTALQEKTTELIMLVKVQYSRLRGFYPSFWAAVVPLDVNGTYKRNGSVDKEV